MVALADLVALFRDQLDAWRSIHLADLHFSRAGAARIALLLVMGLALTAIVVRTAASTSAGRSRVVLPALLQRRRSALALLRHAPLVLFLCGLPPFVLALADPHTALIQEDVSYPGRRISLMIDASSSMNVPFKAETLSARGAGGSKATFFTTVAAAERFVRLRMGGKYRDLMALVEFGNEAYVVTPFTSDYDNILTSIALIGDIVEFTHFPDQGTFIAQAIEQSVHLFKAFDFLDASGNLMVIFSDGEDNRAIVKNRPLREIVQDAVAAKIPIYFIRTNYSKELGSVLPDEQWKDAVEATGGRFYAASDESAILRAIREIDRASAGVIDIKRYTTRQPRYQMFVLIAGALWLLALTLRLTVRYCEKFP